VSAVSSFNKQRNGTKRYLPNSTYATQRNARRTLSCSRTVSEINGKSGRKSPIFPSSVY